VLGLIASSRAMSAARSGEPEAVRKRRMRTALTTGLTVTPVAESDWSSLLVLPAMVCSGQDAAGLRGRIHV